MPHLIPSYANKLTHQNFLQSINSKNNLKNNLHICVYNAFNNYLIKCVLGFTFGDAKTNSRCVELIVNMYRCFLAELILAPKIFLT